MLHQRLGIGIEPFGKSEFSFQNVMINRHGVLVTEGVNSSNHFVEENPKGPPVNWFSVSLVQENLRCQILWSSTKSKCSIFDFLGESEVCDLDIAILGNENVLGLEISVDDIALVQIFKGQNNLGRIETE